MSDPSLLPLSERYTYLCDVVTVMVSLWLSSSELTDYACFPVAIEVTVVLLFVISIVVCIISPIDFAIDTFYVDRRVAGRGGRTGLDAVGAVSEVAVYIRGVQNMRDLYSEMMARLRIPGDMAKERIHRVDGGESRNVISRQAGDAMQGESGSIKRVMFSTIQVSKVQLPIVGLSCAIRKTSEKKLNEVKFIPYGLELITGIHETMAKPRMKVDLVKSNGVNKRKMMKKVEGYFLVVMEVKGFEKVLMIENFRSSRRRKVLIDEDDTWFKDLDEEENMEKHVLVHYILYSLLLVLLVPKIDDLATSSVPLMNLTTPLGGSLVMLDISIKGEVSYEDMHLFDPSCEIANSSICIFPRVKFSSHDPVIHHSGHDIKRTVVEGTVRDRTIGLEPVRYTTYLFAHRYAMERTQTKCYVVSEQDELPSSVGLDFQARLDGGRMERSYNIAQDSSGLRSRSLPLADWSMLLDKGPWIKHRLAPIGWCRITRGTTLLPTGSIDGIPVALVAWFGVVS
ncbi:hypothetical protein Tco_0004668 [Tanacetum coccineum]